MKAKFLTKFFQAKIAFEIPEKYEIKGIYTTEIPDNLIDELMELFDDSEFENAGICSPPLLIVSVHDVPNPTWIQNMQGRINTVLRKYLK